MGTSLCDAPVEDAILCLTREWLALLPWQPIRAHPKTLLLTGKMEPNQNAESPFLQKETGVKGRWFFLLLTLIITSLMHVLTQMLGWHSHTCPRARVHTQTYTHTHYPKSWLGLGKQLSQCCADLLDKQEQVGVSVFPYM